MEKQVLLEKKTGFTFEKTGDNKKTGFVLFAQTKKSRKPVFLINPVFLLFLKKEKKKTGFLPTREKFGKKIWNIS